MNESFILQLLETPQPNTWWRIKDKSVMHRQGSQRPEKYLNIQDCLDKSLKIKFALKST